MSEENKTAAQQPVEKHQESKRYLVFYVIALFSVALVLILLSYVAQAKADRELATLGVQLQEQTTAVQGAEARMEMLQKTVEEQASKLKLLETQLANETEQRALYLEKYKAVTTLLDAQNELLTGDQEKGRIYLDSLAVRYDAALLDGEGEDDLLTAEQAALYQELLALPQLMVNPPAPVE